jgi:hypothetical protein
MTPEGGELLAARPGRINPRGSSQWQHGPLLIFSSIRVAVFGVFGFHIYSRFQGTVIIKKLYFLFHFLAFVSAATDSALCTKVRNNLCAVKDI